MVRGLFPRDERRVLLSMLERSVVFLTRENIETILLKESFDGSAWTLANLYLAGIGAELLSEDAPSLDGFSQDTTCYVSPQYVGRFVRKPVVVGVLNRYASRDNEVFEFHIA